ncbi:MAG: 2-hydroxyacid dehydrogenase [Bacteroidetes bacterium]|nr:MAG: 2-hydroxyacid dehydrogenase [Bacteroidota bacterium]
MPRKIAMFSTKPYDEEYFVRYNTNYGFDFTYFESSLNFRTASLSKGYDVVCVFVNDRVDAQTIEQLAHYGVQLIALRCAGFNNVDLEAARTHGIRVVRVPAYSPEAVAEHALALMLTLNRKTHKAYNRVREGNFSLNKLMGFNLYRKTAGVIGTGKIGVALCRILKGLGCEVLATDPYPSQAVRDLGIDYVCLDELLARSAIISLHCPLTPDTRHLIKQESIAKMREGVMLINTSRGGLVNTADVIAGLSSRKIGYLGIDVYEQEENLFFQDLSEVIIQDDYILKLNSFPNVLITAHQAFFTRESMEEITTTTLENIKAFDTGATLQNELR